MAGGIDAFAALLGELKDRSGQSYGALAKRLHLSTSTLHRYCNGAAVPGEYAPVERFARLCGASPDELVELHRRWILADDARRRKVAPGTASPAEAAAGGEAETAAGAAAVADVAPSPSPVADAAPSPPPPPPVEPEAETAAEPPEDVPGAARQPAAQPRATPRRRFRLALVAAAVVAVVVPTALVAGYAATAPHQQHAAAGPSPSGPGTGTGTGTTHRPPSLLPNRVDGSTAPSASPGSPAPEAGTTGQPAPDEAERPGSTPDTAPSGLPLSVDVRPYVLPDRCDQLYVTGRRPAEVPEPPPGQDARSWATALRAVPGGRMRIEVAVQGKGSQAVVLRALHVRVVGRSAPLDWPAYVMGDGCGGGLTPSFFDVDLDHDRPTARPTAGQQGDIKVPATDFPYRTSSTDPQVLDVLAHTDGHDVSWYLELEWSSGDRHGTLRIDDRGQPFRTSAVKDRPQYVYRHHLRAWEPLPDDARR
ncbi:helix-turn-helix domain-containing protein [Streptomyces sp. SCA3-4]|uniref:helix-turn-helix domain-containing protein n=1 Tax=Streptomyces sichuanensis TaxID=2871810 RepID=UPI001CE24407|nr:helix-turn-helix transcriptional regulator [Streptomyces sichuanensis]MCA6095155.1 helix-turn-helix domain-containing protein [Streptomyces sichuanensis]